MYPLPRSCPTFPADQEIVHSPHLDDLTSISDQYDPRLSSFHFPFDVRTLFGKAAVLSSSTPSSRTTDLGRP